jgi:hypothetical protein
MIHEFKLSCRLGPNHQHRLKHEYSEISNTSAIMYCLIQRTYQYLILPKLINCGARKNGNLQQWVTYSPGAYCRELLPWLVIYDQPLHRSAYMLFASTNQNLDIHYIGL